MDFAFLLSWCRPYARSHRISHQMHDFGSILNFTEQIFRLPSLLMRMHTRTIFPTALISIRPPCSSKTLPLPRARNISPATIRHPRTR
jgi:hypothetical protein